jgi:putative oxidoreductase
MGDVLDEGAVRTTSLAPLAQGVLRIVTGFLFFQHGYPKLIGALPGSGEPSDPAVLLSLLGLSGVLEVVGGTLMMLGLFTRPVAFVLCGEMAVAYFKAHAPRGFWPGSNRGELAALYCFVYLFFAAAGPGRWALDGLRRARSDPGRPDR